MFFSQDPMLLYQQSPYMQGAAISHSPPSRPSFLIDDLLVRRQSPYLVPKQPQDHVHEPQIPSSSGSSFKFGMPGIFSRSREEHSSVYQGEDFINSLNSLTRWVSFQRKFLKLLLRRLFGRRKKCAFKNVYLIVYVYLWSHHYQVRWCETF